MTKQELEALKEKIVALNAEEKLEISKVLVDDLINSDDLGISKTPKLIALLLVAQQQLSKKSNREKVTRIIERYKTFSFNQQEYILNNLLDNADALTERITRSKTKTKTKDKKKRLFYNLFSFTL